jgi:hypothetical protein
MSRLQEVICTKHNLRFAFDADRVRALGQQPALMSCPVCARDDTARVIAERTEVTAHRDLLLKAIDLKALLVPLDPA